MKKEITVLLTKNYADWEIAFICPELNKRSEAFRVTYIGLEKTVISMGGLPVTVDYTIEEYMEQIRKENRKMDMLLLCGGTFWAETKYKEAIVEALVNECLAQGSTIAAICDAVTFLASYAYLNEVKHGGNSWEYIASQCPEYSGSSLYLEKQCVRDGQFITANGTSTLEFSAAIMASFEDWSKKEIEEWYLLQKKGYYES
ncbi:DJ-1/PfpI family protein [Enterococcus sp. BWM-S5]|uniref:DJ-1/PfpI family protein n=1 Tax=Enterococcus larvae TaxID=2794352 RepID=A0ABS4CJL3_9ENTE|nr:DJ-1/PfpI family protein [Enterococcus larvae]MBP1046655.1 DJ-1/PfpI family protein [Enterococcus larvae]